MDCEVVEIDTKQMDSGCDFFTIYLLLQQDTHTSTTIYTILTHILHKKTSQPLTHRERERERV